MSHDQECQHAVKEQCKCVEVAEIARLTAKIKSYEAVVAEAKRTTDMMLHEAHDRDCGCSLVRLKSAVDALPAPSKAGEP